MPDDLEAALKQILEDAGGFGKFEPTAWYHVEADCFFVCWGDKPYVGHRINDTIHLYRDLENEDDVVGFMLWGATDIMAGLDSPRPLKFDPGAYADIMAGMGGPHLPKFEPGAYYCEDSDSVYTYWATGDTTAKRLNNKLTLFYDDRTGNYTGCQIKGASRVMKDEPVGHRGD